MVRQVCADPWQVGCDFGAQLAEGPARSRPDRMRIGAVQQIPAHSTTQSAVNNRSVFVVQIADGRHRTIGATPRIAAEVEIRLQQSTSTTLVRPAPQGGV